MISLQLGQMWVGLLGEGRLTYPTTFIPVLLQMMNRYTGFAVCSNISPTMSETVGLSINVP